MNRGEVRCRLRKTHGQNKSCEIPVRDFRVSRRTDESKKVKAR